MCEPVCFDIMEMIGTEYLKVKKPKRIKKGREPIYLTELSRANIPPLRANLPRRFCDASQFTSYDRTEFPIFLIWKRRPANSPLT